MTEMVFVEQLRFNQEWSANSEQRGGATNLDENSDDRDAAGLSECVLQTAEVGRVPVDQMQLKCSKMETFFKKRVANKCNRRWTT